MINNRVIRTTTQTILTCNSNSWKMGSKFSFKNTVQKKSTVTQKLCIWSWLFSKQLTKFNSSCCADPFFDRFWGQVAQTRLGQLQLFLFLYYATYPTIFFHFCPRTIYKLSHLPPCHLPCYFLKRFATQFSVLLHLSRQFPSFSFYYYFADTLHYFKLWELFGRLYICIPSCCSTVFIFQSKSNPT